MNKEFSDYLDQLSDQQRPATKKEVTATMEKIREKEELPQPSAEQPKKKYRWKPVSLVAACVAVAFAAVTLLTDGNSNEGAAAVPGLDHVYAATSYGDVYDALVKINGDSGLDVYTESAMPMEEEAAADTAAAETPMAEPTAMAEEAPAEAEKAAAAADTGRGANAIDYSGTNVQVEGVDEGDIVKTNGKEIYILRSNEKGGSDLIVLSAAGDQSKVLSSTTVFPGYEETESRYYNEYAGDMYLCGDKLAILSSYYSWDEKTYESTDRTCLHLYDVSDTTAPKEICSSNQDGYYSDSRMISGRLYLISSYYVWNYDEEEPKTYIPTICINDEETLLAAEDVCIVDNTYSSRYTVVTCTDLSSGDLLDQLSVLGGCDQLYMNENNLYLAESRYDTVEGEPYKEAQYTVQQNTDSCTTHLIRFVVDENGLMLAANGTVDGYLESQFSMDEYNGYLRLVTTSQRDSYKIYKDETYGFENWQWDEDASYTGNNLFVLDSDLNTVGSISDLAEDEYIRSARFSGDIAYFVTFRQTDPLFAVDLSDPAAPAVLSALKIPGFSEYLHNYSEGRLFGLGQDADEKTGITSGMKLTMFNTEDPANVTELHTLLLDEGSYSQALYNHKAILISAAHDLIAFPMENGYDVYGYSDESGFYLRGHFDSGEFDYNQRGLYIEDAIYICGAQQTNIVTIDTLSPLLTLDY